MCLFPDKFVILSKGVNKITLYFFTFINTFLILIYNVENQFDIFCSNKKFKASKFEANLSAKIKNYKINKSISYSYSRTVSCIFIFLQNLVIFLTLDNYINIKYRLFFKIIISILLFFSILIILIDEIKCQYSGVYSLRRKNNKIV